jgi:hypothetical protein
MSDNVNVIMLLVTDYVIIFRQNKSTYFLAVEGAFDIPLGGDSNKFHLPLYQISPK